SALGSGNESSNGIGPTVYSLAVLPNGDVLAGGNFDTAGGIRARGLARWNGSAWSILGSEIAGRVLALAVMPNGDLIAGGDFLSIGSASVNRVARWNGSSWTNLGTGISGSVYCLATWPNGDIAAGGQFATAGGVAAHNIARWNGANWSALGAGITDGTSSNVNDIKVLPNGDLLAGGFFTSAGGVTVNNIARWSGSNWSALGSGLTVGLT